MTPEQALQNLYTAARAVPASAEVHDNLKECFLLIQSVIQSKVETGEQPKELV